MRRLRLVLMPVAVIALTASLAAHDFWIEPSTFHPDPGSTVSLGLRVGQDFVGDNVPRSASAIEDFRIRQGGRDEPVTGIDGADPAGFVRADGGSTAIVVYCSRPSFIQMPPARFEDYLRLEGLDAIIALRRARKQSDRPGLEYFSRYAKSLLSGHNPSDAVVRPVGLELEIVPDVDPTGGFAPLRGHLLYSGRPLAGALVVAMPRNGSPPRLTARTDDHGRFTLPLPHGGVWLIKSVHMIEAGWLSRADWRSLWASLTFDAGGAPPKSRAGFR